jgi:hypothetical protein
MPADLKAVSVSVETNPRATSPTKERVVATGGGS